MNTNNEEKLKEITLQEYTPPTVQITSVEMESGIAANSGTALPASTNTPVNESWNNDEYTPAPVEW
ncbi:hypothetical protein BAX95_09695 [Elizabethkingia meningoseptica]|uniref:hypothetical protein n=1 Tax=Elizabethkingia meningoseptica TaxID=238 RepID=UPI00099B167B|nr:hypothetical protein [Elizabethkingia meningoseptica]OPC20633.1 hypothetical protein BAX95_09695 [Elizabethkingia meningoseptica]